MTLPTSDMRAHPLDPDGPPRTLGREDVSDLASLPKRFDQLAARVDHGFEMIGNRILTAIERLTQRADDQDARQDAQDRRQDAHEIATARRFEAIEARLPVVTKRRKTARK